VAPGESTLEAARRELSEELSLAAISVGRTLFRTRDGASPFVIEFVEVSVASPGAAVAHEHTEIGWFSAADLARLPLAPADRAFVASLAGPHPGSTA
jgi:8-oxo-dGTP pyrophosphatase MutT (NUDIX family)